MIKACRIWLAVFILFFSLATVGPVSYAQEAAAAPAAAVASDSESSSGISFFEVVFKQGILNLFIWLLIFGTSFATIAFVIDGLLIVRREKILPSHVVFGVREALDEGDLGTAIQICETNPCQLSNILMAGFGNIAEGYEVIQEAVTAATDLESEKIIQRISYLNLCGQIAPMLGLLGTVIGMVQAFGVLGNGETVDKDTKLAEAIHVALYTTVFGLIISVPAILAYTIYKNLATTRLLESEATVLDLIKTLRGAEVEGDDDEDEDEYDEDEEFE